MICLVTFIITVHPWTKVDPLVKARQTLVLPVAAVQLQLKEDRGIPEPISLDLNCTKS